MTTKDNKRVEVDEDNSKFNTIEKYFEDDVNKEHLDDISKQSTFKVVYKVSDVGDKKRNKKVTFDDNPIVVSIDNWKDLNMIEDKAVTDCDCQCMIV
jgi:hypothetical protein